MACSISRNCHILGAPPSPPFDFDLHLKSGKTKQSTVNPPLIFAKSPSLAAAALQFACLQVNFQHEYLFILPLQRSKWSCVCCVLLWQCIVVASGWCWCWWVVYLWLGVQHGLVVLIPGPQPIPAHWNPPTEATLTPWWIFNNKLPGLPLPLLLLVILLFVFNCFACFHFICSRVACKKGLKGVVGGEYDTVIMARITTNIYADFHATWALKSVFKFQRCQLGCIRLPIWQACTLIFISIWCFSIMLRVLTPSPRQSSFVSPISFFSHSCFFLYFRQFSCLFILQLSGRPDRQ